MKLEDFDERDILLCEVVVTDSKGKVHTRKAVYSKGDKDDLDWVLNKLKIKSPKNVIIKPIKKIGEKNA